MKVDIGANDTRRQINLEDLSNIRQLEALFRAQTLLALAAGPSSPLHPRCCLVAYACIVRVWQVRFCETGYVITWPVYFKLPCASYSRDVLPTSSEFPVLWYSWNIFSVLRIKQENCLARENKEEPLRIKVAVSHFFGVHSFVLCKSLSNFVFPIC